MEWLIATFGAKFCCIFSAGCGGVTNWAVNKKIKPLDLLLSIFVGWVAAEFFIPAIMAYWKFPPEVALAISYIIGYCGIRLLPMIENKIKKKLGGEE